MFCEINNKFKPSNINKETLTLELYSTVEFCVYVRSMELYWGGQLWPGCSLLLPLPSGNFCAIYSSSCRETLSPPASGLAL
jgi:hypothetical protein